MTCTYMFLLAIPTILYDNLELTHVCRGAAAYGAIVVMLTAR